MTRNTGKPSEKIFEDRIHALGKIAYLDRVADSSEIHGRNKGKALNVRAVSSDYILTLKGEIFYAEVKSTQDETAFRFSMIGKIQKARAAMVSIAGGSYCYFVHNLNTDKWYKIPARVVINHPKQSIRWDELGSYEWK